MFSLLAVVVTPARSEDIFLVASYHQADACGLPQYEAAIDALEQGGFGKLSQKVYHLDARLKLKQQVRQQVEQIKKDIRAAAPRLVLTMDDTAFSLLYEEMLQQPDKLMVFSGINRDLGACRV